MIALVEGGAVYTWGSPGDEDGYEDEEGEHQWWDDGGLGHGDHVQQLVPKEVEALRGVPVVAVAAASTVSLVTDANGVTHAFGYGAAGALGVGDRQDRVLPTPVAFE